MKKWFVLASLFLLSACSNSGESSTEDTHIVVAAQTPPMTDIVELADEVIEEPYTVELMEVTDNIQYNEAVFNDEADANFAQHEPFMEQFNKENDADLVAMSEIYNAIVGFYSPIYDDIDQVQDGDEVAIPSDPTNEARVYDIVDNPKNLEFTHVDLLNLSASYEDEIPLVFNYPTYIEPLGLTPKDAVLLEDEDDSTFALRLVTRSENVDTEKMKALNKAFTSEEVYEYLSDLKDKAHLEPAFE